MIDVFVYSRGFCTTCCCAGMSPYIQTTYQKRDGGNGMNTYVPGGSSAANPEKVVIIVYLEVEREALSIATTTTLCFL